MDFLQEDSGKIAADPEIGVNDDKADPVTTVAGKYLNCQAGCGFDPCLISRQRVREKKSKFVLTAHIFCLHC